MLFEIILSSALRDSWEDSLFTAHCIVIAILLKDSEKWSMNNLPRVSRDYWFYGE